jgi:hypothetical protein
MADATEERVEYVTIVGNSFDEVAEECRTQRLHEKHYAILHPIQRHTVTMAGASEVGRSLVMATFSRRLAI